jgi:glyoxylase-like metal-dependent hydrolase (beta-lactamase superfamily II)
MPQFADMQSVTIGDKKVTFLPDGGGIVEPTALYPASSPDGWKKYPALLNDDGKFITTIGAFLIEMSDRIIAVDLGIGPVTIDFPGFGPFSGGNYMANLQKTDVSPEAVTDVVFTHLHLDHCGWTTQEIDGQRRLTYPNARYFVTATEWEFWHGGDNPAGPHPEFVQKPLENRIETFARGDTLAPGITVVSTPGHTPGHVSLLITAGDERLYLLGDVLHGTMQLQEKDWSVAFDLDAETARQTREQLYPELVMPNTICAAGHFSNVVFGHIKQSDNGQLAWVAL